MRSVFHAAVLAASFFVPAGAALGSILDTTPGVVYHLDAGAGVSLTGTDVTAWADQSGNGRDFSQATTVKQPDLIAGNAAGNINGLPVVRFDGDLTGNSGGIAPNADELILPTSTTLQTIVVVNRTLAHRNLDGMLGDNDADAGLRRASATNWQHPGNTNDFSNGGSMYVNGGPGTAAPLNTPHILIATRGATTTFNDTSIGDYFRVGTNTPRSWNGDIAELAVYNRALTASEQQQIESFLSAKYNIALVPEPGMLGLAVFGLGAAALRRRRQLA